MELLKIGVFVSMLSMTPMLEAQNTSGLQKEQPLLLLEENLEQLSIGNEEEYGWEDELEELSRHLQELSTSMPPLNGNWSSFLFLRIYR